MSQAECIAYLSKKSWLVRYSLSEQIGGSMDFGNWKTFQRPERVDVS